MDEPWTVQDAKAHLSELLRRARRGERPPAARGSRRGDPFADVAEVAGGLRAVADTVGQPADPLDALIAACALVRGASLATRTSTRAAGRSDPGSPR